MKRYSVVSLLGFKPSGCGGCRDARRYDQAGNDLGVNGNTLAYDAEEMVATETSGGNNAVEAYV